MQAKKKNLTHEVIQRGNFNFKTIVEICIKVLPKYIIRRNNELKKNKNRNQE